VIGFAFRGRFLSRVVLDLRRGRELGARGRRELPGVVLPASMQPGSGDVEGRFGASLGDRIRRERIVSIRAGGDTDFLNVLVDEISPERRASASEELTRLARAFDRLSNKCREVVWLRRVKALPQNEAADNFGLRGFGC